MRVVRGRIILLTAALSLLALRHWAWQPIQCSQGVTDLTRRTNSAAGTRSDYERTVRARRNLQDLADLKGSCPTDVRLPMLAGANYELLGNLDGAVREYEAALKTDRRPEIHLALANAEMQRGRFDEATRNFAEAARFHPVFLNITSVPQLRERVREEIRKARRNPDAY